jgi:putative hydrolase of HD superfamily
VYRRTLLLDGSRYENDAEHSWHLALMAVLLREYANDPRLDLARVIKMVLVHDLVEIDAGDTYCYDDRGNRDKAEREAAAADRLFALLPGDQSSDVREMWNEFEARETPEARFAAALDRLQPLMHNYFTGGQIWQKHGVASGKVRDRNRHIEDGSRMLWEYADSLIRSAVDHGFLEP